MKNLLIYCCLSIGTLGSSLLGLPGKVPVHIEEKPMQAPVAEIVRDKESKKAYLKIKTANKWRLFAGPSSEEIDMTRPVLKGNGSGTFALDVPAGSRSYFMLLADDAKMILAERHLPMSGGYNFRDLGGYRTQDGRETKWGKIFRSDDLHGLTEQDLAYLASIPLTTIVDFRSEEEIKQAPDRLPASVKKDYPYTISPGNLSAAAATSDLSALQAMNMDSIMQEINRQLVTDSASISRYRSFFALLQEKENMPLLFHCSAGKDRTGLGAALILYALGVDEETIMRDYLLSNEYIGEKYAPYIRQYPELKPLFEVRPAYLQAGIQKIKEKHGTVDNFLQNRLNVNLCKFRDMYLY